MADSNQTMNTQLLRSRFEESSFPPDEGAEGEFKPMTAEQAQEWRKRNPSISIWRIIRIQLLVGAVAVLLITLFARSMPVALSSLYGVLVVVLPAAIFARGVTRQSGRVSSIGALVVWELAKLVLSIVLLVLAPQIVANLHWLAMIGTMIAIMNVYWVVLFARPAKPKPIGES